MAGELEIPKSVKIINPEPVDFYYGPWATLAAAKSGVPLAIRYDGLTVQITGTGEYHWLAADLTDTGLITKGGGGALPITHYVYLVSDVSDALLMGGVTSNVYTTFQTAYNAAVAIITANPTYNVVIKVGMTTAAQVGDLTITAAAVNKSDKIYIAGITNAASILGNINASGGSFLYLNLSNIRIGNIDNSGNYINVYNSTSVQIGNITSCFSVYIVSCDNIEIGNITAIGGIVSFPSTILTYGSSYVKLGDIVGTNISFDFGTPENGSNWNGHYSPTIITNIDVTNARHFQMIFRSVTIVHDFTYNVSFASITTTTFVFENTKVYGTTTINKSGNPQNSIISSCSFEDLILTGSTFSSLTMKDTTFKRIIDVPANTTFMNSTVFSPNMVAAPAVVGLNIGQKYEIVTYVAGDNFTNIGAASNASGVIFTATGSFPTNWYNKSIVRNYEAINGIGTNCEFYNTSIVGGSLAIDNASAVSVKFTTGMSASQAGMGVNVTLT